MPRLQQSPQPQYIRLPRHREKVSAAMCCCKEPNLNGQPGFQWQPHHAPGIYPINPPTLEEHETLLYDEPGRCGHGLDAHCHHYRLVTHWGSLYLLAQHGGGRESIRLHHTKPLLALLATLGSDTRYSLLHTLYYAHHDGKQEGASRVESYWRTAAAEQRIRTRKHRGSTRVTVSIRPPA